MNARKTHLMLSEYLDLGDFDNLLKECDECTIQCVNNGRILTHAIKEIVTDLIPTFCYNNVTDRFVKGAVFYTEPSQRAKFPNVKWIYLYGTKVI